MPIQIKLRRKSGPSTKDTIYSVADWNYLVNKPSTYPPTTHNHNASDVNSGTLSADRIPSLDAAKIATGTIGESRIPTLAQSKITNLVNDLANKENIPFLEIIRPDGGGAKFTKFLEVDYNTTTTERGVYVKISMRAGHGNAFSYVFNQDIFIQVTSIGDVIVRSPKFYSAQSTISGRNYGDIAFTIDSLNKIVKFYTLLGQYSRAFFTPPVRLNASTGGVITPKTGNYDDDFDSGLAVYAQRQWYGVKDTDANFIYDGDVRLTNARPASDVFAWAKAANKPTYNLDEVIDGTIRKLLTLGETSLTAYRGDRGKIAYDHSQVVHAPSGAQANVLEAVQVAGSDLAIISKKVNIPFASASTPGVVKISVSGTTVNIITT